MKKLLNKQQGFTIIEVMIVLVIAAVILLIVFLAVPALQRNSRNTQIRNDASVLLGYVNDYTANANGAMPGVVCYDSATGDVGMVASGACSPSGNNVGKIRGGVTFVSSNQSSQAQPTAANSLTLKLGHKCAGSTITGGTANGRAAAVGFVTETGTGTTNQCLET